MTRSFGHPFRFAKEGVAADAAVDDPGSVTTGLRMYLPMTHAADLEDETANEFDATPTDLTIHAGYYEREIGLGVRASGTRIKGVRHFNIAGRGGYPTADW